MILDLFAGPGGWDTGCAMIGRTDVVGIEYDANACATRAAAGHATIRADVSQYPTAPFIGRVEGLIASPPCQAWSQAGSRKGQHDKEIIWQVLDDIARGNDTRAAALPECSDPRSLLVVEPLRWALDLAPEWIACEQVPPVLELWEILAEYLSRAGYRSTWTGELNAANYGVPQTRRRAFLLASAHGIAMPPDPTHAKNPEPNLFGEGEKPWVTMAEALGWSSGEVGFPRINDTADGNEYRERDFRSTDDVAFSVTGKARSWSRSVNTGRDWKKGGTRADAQIIDADDNPAPTVTGKSGERRLLDRGEGDTPQWLLNPGRTATQPNRRLDTPDEPAPTIAFGHDANNWEWQRPDQRHVDNAWTDTRPATTVMGDPRIAQPGYRGRPEEYSSDGTYTGARSMDGAIKIEPWEAAVLQSFPRNYPWRGSRTAQFLQIGNAVAVYVAAAVIGALTGADWKAAVAGQAAVTAAADNNHLTEV